MKEEEGGRERRTPVPVELLRRPVHRRRARRVGGEDAEDENAHGRSTDALGPEVGDDAGGDRTFNARGDAAGFRRQLYVLRER